MKTLIWLLRFVVFVLFLGLAIKNSGPVELKFFFDQAWSGPLSLVLLASFVLGIAVGLTVTLASHVRQRREIARLKRAQATVSRDPA